jgi:hypothetical protein
MKWYTAEYEKSQNKTFMADSRTEADEHADIIGYDETALNVREATEGEIEGAETNLRRSYHAIR